MDVNVKQAAKLSIAVVKKLEYFVVMSVKTVLTVPIEFCKKLHDTLMITSLIQEKRERKYKLNFLLK